MTKHIDIDEALESSGALQVKSLWKEVQPLLYEEVQNMLKHTVKATTGADYSVRFIGFRGPQIGLDENCKKLAKLINEACMAFRVKGLLSPPVKIDLAMLDPHKEPQSMYVSYIAFTHEAARAIDNLANGFFFTEEEMPKEIGAGDDDPHN